MARFLCPWNSPGQNTGVGSHSLLQGIFPTPRSNWGLLHCRLILYQLSYEEAPIRLAIKLALQIRSTHYVPMPWAFWSELDWSDLAHVLLATQSCPTLCGPKDCNLPVSSVHGILQARILEWVVTAFSRASFQPRDQTRVFCIAGRFFTMVNPKGSPQTPLFNHKVSNELLLHSYHFSQD